MTYESLKAKDVGYQNYYKGRDWEKRVRRFFSKIDISDGCWNWTGHIRENEYGRFDIAPGVITGAHRASFIIHFGGIPDGLFVCHTCDNKKCVNPSHLFCGTQKDNIRDMISKGRKITVYGEKCGTSKLTEKDVKFILTSSQSGRIIANHIGVSRRTIDRVRSGAIWGHLTGIQKK